MPELPEVVTVIRKLKDKVLNKKIKNINVLYPNIVTDDSIPLTNLINKEILNITNKGKFILFHFDEYILISHLRMEGKYHIKNLNEEITKHEHIIFDLEDFSLRYDDVRKFGRMTLIYKEDLLNHKSIANLGKEPFEINYKEFYDIIKTRRRPIKSILLDQHIISGLGNIYANEVLFDSKINPHKKGINITLKESEKLITSSKEILNKAIKEGGTSVMSYSSLGGAGNYQNFLKVHMKTNCPVCNTKLIKEQIGGRGTYYCPKCQK